MARRKKPAAKATARRVKLSPDTTLIKECVIYAQSVAAFEAGFNADPDGDCRYAAPLGNRHEARSQQALTKIAAMSATTAAGLQSKALILSIAIDHQEGMMGGVQEDFLRSFAADVKAFLEPLVNADSVAEKSAARLAA